jgi:DNA (cytosine-5)-methyltransferase 1
MFSGIGGFDLAMRNLGHEIVGACEIDKYARQIYAKQFPGVPIHNDATTLQGDTLPQFDVLCGGFPCQAFSIAGKRKGFSDTRGSLFFEIARIAKEKQPSILFLENVKGLFNHDNGETFRTILSSLDEVGYDVEWQLHNSKYHVPQNRERVYIVGHLRGQRTRQVFPLGRIDKKIDKSIKQSRIKYNLKSDRQAERVYDGDGLAPTLGHGNATSQPFIAVVNDRKGLRKVKRATCLDANYFKGHDYHGARTLIYKLVKAVLTPDRAETRQVGRRFKEDGEPAFAVTTQDRHGVMIENKPTEMIYFSNTNANMKQRIQEKETSWTLGTGTDFGIKEDKKIRKLTPVECERLQGFPDGWTEGISDTQRYKCCGNAVTVPVVQWIASHFNIGSTE